jgi:hypothetical protein
MGNSRRAIIRLAKERWGSLPTSVICNLCELAERNKFSLAAGDICFLQGSWYVTHSGLLALARRHRCAGIDVQLLTKLCDPEGARWVFRAIVYPNERRRGFVGYGDANPFNVSLPMRGAEMRIAETRAVNRALRKAYGIGICSVEEIGSLERQQNSVGRVRKLAPESQNANDNNTHDVNRNGSRLRDRLCQIIRQYKLDAELVKSYAIDFCGTKTLRDASRESVENFIAHLADWARKDRNALLCQLNSYARQNAGAA